MAVLLFIAFSLFLYTTFVQLVLVPQGGSQHFVSLLFLLPLAPHLIHLFSRRFLLHQEFILWKLETSAELFLLLFHRVF